MAFNELIKDFGRSRDYMRLFFVYGFMTREEFTQKSGRSYDNERRRVESWLGEHMAFRQDAAGKSIFMALDSSEIGRNPLYAAFRAKSFTDNDIVLHFYLMDILSEKPRTIPEIMGEIDSRLSAFDREWAFDESTLRKKIGEYESLGIITSRRQGRVKVYALSSSPLPPPDWRQALAFFSEEAPLGVIGSYLLDRMAPGGDCFRFKHHYTLHALESDVLYALLLAMGEKREVRVLAQSTRRESAMAHQVVPLQILISTQTGRRYLLTRHQRYKKLMLYRLDSIKSVKPGDMCAEHGRYMAQVPKFKSHLWGASSGVDFSLDDLEMTLYIGPDEEYVLKRLEREKRGGQITRLDDRRYRFSIQVYDAAEMLPWLRTFIGRIVDLRSSNPHVLKTFEEDLASLNELYAEENHAVP